jgi:hypothetical protein
MLDAGTTRVNGKLSASGCRDARRLTTGRILGYQFDAMAIGQFVLFAERLLADYKSLLREDENALSFAEILDVFVDAGWPQATQIVLPPGAVVRRRQNVPLF